MAWDVIVPDTYAESHIGNTATKPEALRPGSVLVRRERRESLGKEECLWPRLKNCNRANNENSFRS